METTIAVPNARLPFARDRFTWTCYLLLGYFAYLQSLLGPIMPFLRAELGMSYVVGSLHVSASAAGMVLVGLMGGSLLNRLGFRRALWGGALGMAAGAVLLTLGTHIAVTLGATLLMGLIGTLLLAAQQASLAYHHGPSRTIAFTEGNIFASLASMVAPLAVGLGVTSGIGWRMALFLPLPILAGLLIREGRKPVPEPVRATDMSTGSARLPVQFWVFWSVACLSVAAEWSVGFWAADYLHTIVGFALEQAVTTLSIFFLAMLLGRMIGSWLARRLPPIVLLGGALALALVGAVCFWLSPSTTITLVGLAITGLGIGNLFPLSLSVAISMAPHQPSAASARMTLSGGLAILIAPLLLGSIADQIGLRGAFAIVPALLGIALLGVLLAGRVWISH